ncbi:MULTISPECIES: NmrA/HSCARG family protein [unclassified Saccharothrix]|uniref:NmrA/HSCARG family protein n=1 Tax=unclassified Saccharothrix TaxID=2593673 RepID=UPI00307D0A83
MSGTVLVTGATGQQGGATARRLLDDGWEVRALVRSAERFVPGTTPVVGDMLDRAALDRAMEGVHGVFSVQPAAGPPHFDVDEVAMGKNVADAALAAGVRHFVYASVGGAERDSGISHWNTKWEIERHIRALGLPATILRPVMFLENHASATTGVLGPVPLVRMMPARRKVQVVAVRDIGAFAGLAFADPDRFVGREVELAGDEVTREELATAFGEVLGRPVDTSPLPPEALAALGLSLDDLERAERFAGWRADLPALRAEHPGLLDFRSWLAEEGAALARAAFGGRPAA